MALKVTDEQRQQVRRALSEAGAKQDTVGAFKDGDLDVLFSNGWKSKGLILNAQQDLLLAKGISAGAVGVIMSLKQGEPSFLTCFCSWESCHAWQKRDLHDLPKKSWTFRNNQTSPLHTRLDHLLLCLVAISISCILHGFCLISCLLGLSSLSHALILHLLPILTHVAPPPFLQEGCRIHGMDIYSTRRTLLESSELQHPLTKPDSSPPHFSAWGT